MSSSPTSKAAAADRCLADKCCHKILLPRHRRFHSVLPSHTPPSPAVISAGAMLPCLHWHIAHGHPRLGTARPGHPAHSSRELHGPSRASTCARFRHHRVSECSLSISEPDSVVRISGMALTAIHVRDCGQSQSHVWSRNSKWIGDGNIKSSSLGARAAAGSLSREC